MDVGTSIPESPGLHEQVASYKNDELFERRKDLAQSNGPHFWPNGLKWRKVRIFESRY
jgi:hypothetical protein